MNTSQHDAWTQPERKTPKITTHIQDDLNDRLYTEPSVNTKSRDGRGLSLVSQLRENDRQCIHVTRRRSFVEKLLDCFTCNAIEGGVHLVPQLLLFVSCIWYVTCFGFVGFACSHDKIQAHKVLEEMDALFLSLFLVLIRTGRKCWTDIAIHDMVSFGLCMPPEMKIIVVWHMKILHEFCMTNVAFLWKSDHCHGYGDARTQSPSQACALPLPLFRSVLLSTSQGEQMAAGAHHACGLPNWCLRSPTVERLNSSGSFCSFQEPWSLAAWPKP